MWEIHCSCYTEEGAHRLWWKHAGTPWDTDERFEEIRLWTNFYTLGRILSALKEEKEFELFKEIVKKQIKYIHTFTEILSGTANP